MKCTKFSKIAVVGLISSLALVGCSNSGAGNDSSNSSAGGAKVTIEVWDYLGEGSNDTAMKAIVKSFEEKNPNITVKRTSFAFADLAKSIVQGGIGGQVPDVAVVDVVDNQNFASLGLLEDITAAESSKSSQFYAGPWSSGQFNGKTYGVPLNSNNVALFYNKDLLAAAGKSVPTNWTELRDTAKALATGGRMGIAVSGLKNEQSTFQFLPFLWQTGGDLKTYAKDGATALGFLRSLIDDGAMSKGVANYSQEDARTQFVTGKTAMMINGPWELPGLAKTNINFDVAPLPKDKVAATDLGGENVVLFSGSKNKAAGLKFLDFITSPEGATVFCNASGQLSARPDLAGKLAGASDAKMQVFEKQLADAHARAYGANYPEISAAVQDSLQKVLSGVATPEQAAKDAAVIIDSKLA